MRMTPIDITKTPIHNFPDPHKRIHHTEMHYIHSQRLKGAHTDQIRHGQKHFRRATTRQSQAIKLHIAFNSKCTSLRTLNGHSKKISAMGQQHTHECRESAQSRSQLDVSYEYARLRDKVTHTTHAPIKGTSENGDCKVYKTRVTHTQQAVRGVLEIMPAHMKLKRGRTAHGPDILRNIQRSATTGHGQSRWPKHPHIQNSPLHRHLKYFTYLNRATTHITRDGKTRFRNLQMFRNVKPGTQIQIRWTSSPYIGTKPDPGHILGKVKPKLQPPNELIMVTTTPWIPPVNQNTIITPIRLCRKKDVEIVGATFTLLVYTSIDDSSYKTTNH